MAGGAESWTWAHLGGGHVEQQVADLCSGEVVGTGLGRGCVIVQTNSRSAFHVIFSRTPNPSRGSDEPVLRFVVGKRRNSMTSLGFGNPYIRKEPVDFTRSSDALLTDDEEKSRTYWFLYDRSFAVAAMGVQGAPQADLSRLVCRFSGDIGFKAEACEELRYIFIGSGRQASSVRIVNVCEPPDVSIPRFRFDPEAWKPLPWNGCSCVFEVDDTHRRLVEKVQACLAKSPLMPFYALVPPGHLCLNIYRLLDPLRRREMLPSEIRDTSDEEPEWHACYDELRRRLLPVLASAPWTYVPLQFERADCTAITLAASAKGCSKVITEWCGAVRNATGLRNGATNREMLTLAFAYEVFPVEGEGLAQARRDVIREVTAILEKEWGVMEFRAPLLACWRTEHEYISHEELRTAA
eukprot:TRINITY_DN25977_c0_g1_i1.p1 TRINITY_DN25977_c0_g1~~TRINITY_DN25977_c0_g1_i1.p1  ORF type:complete len:409 (-),score=53.49 TRINITY_DN25977_c0_g1_i1:222-1448(-)